jgi:hypothetical protein
MSGNGLMGTFGHRHLQSKTAHPCVFANRRSCPGRLANAPRSSSRSTCKHSAVRSEMPCRHKRASCAWLSCYCVGSRGHFPIFLTQRHAQSLTDMHQEVLCIRLSGVAKQRRKWMGRMHYPPRACPPRPPAAPDVASGTLRRPWSPQALRCLCFEAPPAYPHLLTLALPICR